jgi:hypothetical protein
LQRVYVGLDFLSTCAPLFFFYFRLNGFSHVFCLMQVVEQELSLTSFSLPQAMWTTPLTTLVQLWLPAVIRATSVGAAVVGAAVESPLVLLTGARRYVPARGAKTSLLSLFDLPTH